MLETTSNSPACLPSDVSRSTHVPEAHASLPPLIPSDTSSNTFHKDRPLECTTYARNPNQSASSIPGILPDRPSVLPTVPNLLFPLTKTEMDSFPPNPRQGPSSSAIMDVQLAYRPGTNESALKLRSDPISPELENFSIVDIFVVGAENWFTFAAEFHNAIMKLHDIFPLKTRHAIPNILGGGTLEAAVKAATQVVVNEERRLISRYFGYPPRMGNTITEEYYDRVRKFAYDRVNTNWVPHLMSSEEIARCTQDTRGWVTRIEGLERYQSKAGSYDPRLTDELHFSRYEYEARFPRVFRINDLPTEVLTNIFRLSIWAASSAKEGINWRLWTSWVCQRWRTTLLGDSTLWNAIWFRDVPHFERSFAWLERAGDAPLDVRFNDGPTYKFTFEAMSRLLDKVLLKISTIRMFIVIVQDYQTAVEILNRLNIVRTQNIPVIFQRFELHYDGKFMADLTALRDPMPLFGGAVVPSLEYFSVNGVPIDWEASHFENLTAIDIRRIASERAPTLTRFRKMLTSSPRLYKLILDGAGPAFQASDDVIPSIPLLDLKFVVYANFSPSYGVYLLSQFHAPNVVDFTLMDFDGLDYGPFYARLATCCQRVELLTFWNAHSTWTDRARLSMLKWLENMPVVSFLRLARIRQPLMDMFLYDSKTLTYATPQSQHLICPKIRVLECHGFDSAGPDYLIRWIEKRGELGLPLKKLYLSRKYSDTFTKEQYLALVRTGISIAVLLEGAVTPEEEAITKQDT